MVKRKKIVAGNWKMNLLADEAMTLFNELSSIEIGLAECIIFPPVIYLPLFSAQKKARPQLGVQNFYPMEKGAFTGEVSIAQVANSGAKYALIGHSERRMIFNESHSFLKDKVNAALAHNVQPVFCCGESMEIRANGTEQEYVKNQLIDSLFHLSKVDIQKCIVAYEPIWAIGTGLTATSQQAEDMHAFIRSLIAAHYSNEIAAGISILYGGSCNPSNASELFSCENVDGGLIGGASLDSESFKQILHSF